MSAPQKSAWNNHRRWKRALLISVPIGFILGLPMTLFGFDIGKLVMSLPTVAGLIYFQYYTCPQCNECFCYKPRFLSRKVDWFTGKCVHCGLPKWQEPAPKPPNRKINIYPIPGESPTCDPAIAEKLRLAEFLTLVLRDDPKAIDLGLDPDGWPDVDDLLMRAQRNGIKLTHENMVEALSTSPIDRCDWDKAGNRIRVVRTS